MGTRTCPSCGHKVDTNADACPQCGRKGKRPLGRLQWIGIIILGGFVLNSIVPSNTPAVSRPEQPVPPTPHVATSTSADAPRAFQEPKPTVTAEDRERLLTAATKKLKRERDKIEKTTFYMAPNDGLRTQVGAYFGVADGGSPYLRMKTVYYGDNWVFYDAVKIMADDEIVYEKAFNRRDITRDNEAGSVWEVADYVATPSDLLALQTISKAKSVTVRFAGRDRIRDHKMTSAEKAGLKSVLTAYVDLKQKL